MRTYFRALLASLAAAVFAVPAWASYTALGRAYTNIFRGTSDANWATLDNWSTTADNGSTWTARGGDHAPGTPNSNDWEAALVDGGLLSDTITVTDNYKEIAGPPELEGWNSQIGVANGVHLTIPSIKKLQGGACEWRVDADSKITVTTFGTTSGNSAGDTNLYVAAPEGVVFKGAFSGNGTPTLKYHLGTGGSVCFEAATGAGTHTVAEVALACGDAAQSGKTIVERKLVAFTSTSVTFTYASAGVTAQDSAGTAVSTLAETRAVTLFDPVGTYFFEQKADGYYVQFVAYGTEQPSTYERTLSGGDAAWSDSGVWQNGATAYDAPSQNAAAHLTVTSPATLTMNAAASLTHLDIEGEGALTFAAGEGEGAGALTAANTVVGTDVDASAGVASLGAVTLAAGKTLTVTAASPFDSLAGAGTLAYAAATADTEISKAFADVFTGTLKVTQGNLVFAAGNNGTGYPQQAGVTLSGANAKMTLKTATDTTGYGDPSANKRLIVEQGATLAVERRDTFNMPLVLNAGHVTFAQDEQESGRSFDLFTASSIDASGESTIGGAAATNDAETGDPIVASGIVSVRRADFPFTVAEGGTLKVYAQMRYDQASGTVAKNGAGTLEFFRPVYGAATIPVSVNAGVLRLTNKGQATTGAYAVAQGATLELSATTDAFAQTFPNTLSGAGAVRKVGAGKTTLSGNLSDFSGTVTATEGTLEIAAAVALAEGGTTPLAVSAGTLIVPAGMEGRVASVAEGATLKIRLTAEQTEALGYTAQGLPEGVKPVFLGPDTDEAITEGVSEDGLSYTAPLNTWEPKTPTEGDASKYAWDNTANWSRTSLPAEGENVRIRVDAAAATMVLPASDVTVGEVTFAGTEGGSLTIETQGGALTAAGHNLFAQIDVAAPASALAYGRLEVSEGKTVTLTVPEGVTYASGRLTGPGTVAKEGAGILQITTPSAAENVLLESLTLDIRAGGLSTLQNIDSIVFRSSTVRFAEGATFTSHGWVELEGTVTFDVAGDLTFGAASGVTPCFGGTGTLRKAGAGSLTYDLRGSSHATPTVIEGGTMGYIGGGTGTLTGVISGAGAVNVVSGTIVLSGANTYAGGTTVNEGATLSIADIAKVGGAGAKVSVNGTLTFTSTGNLNEEGIDLSGLSGNGTVEYSGSGWRTLPNSLAHQFRSTLALKNEQEDGLIVALCGDASPTTTIGTLSGSKPFRVDWENKNAESRTLRIVQAANSEHTGNLIHDSYYTRLTEVLVAGAAGATEKTLTLSGSTSNARSLKVEDSGSVSLTGSWAGAVTVSGRFGGTGTVGGELTINGNATLDATLGALTVTGNVNYPIDPATFTVALPADFAATTEGRKVIAKSGVSAPVSGAYTLKAGETVITDAVLAVRDDGLYVVKPTVTPPAGSPTLDDDTQEAIAVAAAKVGVATVTIAADSAPVEGATLFTGVEVVVTPDEQNPGVGTAKVSYDFGIKRMTVSKGTDSDQGLYVVLTACVQSDSNNSVGYAETTKVKVYKVVDGVEAEITDAEVVENDDSSVKQIRFPLDALQTVTRSGETSDRGTFGLIIRAESTTP